MPAVSNDKGIALLYIVMVVVFIGVVVAAAALLTGPLAQRSKTVEARGVIDSAVQSVIGYAATNRRLPTTAQFDGAVRKANDAWGNPLYYIADGNLAPSSPGASSDYICGRSATSITVRQCLTDNCATYNDITNVAFVVVSGGKNFNVQTALTGTRVTVYTQNDAADRDDCTTAANCPSYNGTMINRPERYDDIVKWVTLEELKNKMGCYGSTPGRFKVLNNELPAACIGQSYSATLYSDGGVTPYGNWTWAATVLPAGLSMNFNTGVISGTPTGQAQVHNITFSRSDSVGNAVQKILKLMVVACPLGSWSFDDPANLGGAITTGPGGSIASVAGSSGSALFFSGISTFTPNNQGVGNSRFSFEYNQPFSLVMWVKLTKFPTTAPVSTVYPFVSKAGPSPDYNGYYLELHGSNYPPPPNTAYHRIAFRLVGRESAPPRFIYVYNTTPINTLSTWYHVAVSYSGSGLASGVKLYVNGASANTTSRDNLSSSTIVNTEPLRLGDYGRNYYNSVVMDEVQVYNSVVRQLRLIKAGSGTGAVVSPALFVTPERINCGTVCEAYYVTGTIVTLYASASPGSTFAGWSGGGCTGTGDCTVTLSSDTDVTATFTSP